MGRCLQVHGATSLVSHGCYDGIVTLECWDGEILTATDSEPTVG
jgi:hypothetical protein